MSVNVSSLAALFTDLYLSMRLPLELGLAALLYGRALPPRRLYPGRVALCAAAVVAATVVTRYLLLKGLLPIPAGENFFDGSISSLLLSLQFSLASFVLALGLLCFCRKSALPEALYCVTCAYLTQHTAYCLHRLAQLCGLTAAWARGSAYLLIYAAVYFLLLRLMRRAISERGYLVDLRQTLSLTAAALAVALVFSAVGQQLQTQSLALYRLCLGYAAACCAFVLWGQAAQQRRLRLQEEYDLQRQLWQTQRAQYELSARNVELINRKCHDLKHQIAALRGTSDPSVRERNINEMEQAVLRYDAMADTGNPILDTVLTEKELLCQEKGAQLACVADGASLDFMDAVDLYTLFGNALDNAIESAVCLPDPERRVISVQVFRKAGMTLIQIENCFQGPLAFGEDGLPATTKGGEPGWHGYGLRSIRDTVEKYGGVLRLWQEDQVFFLRIGIPRYDN